MVRGLVVLGVGLGPHPLAGGGVLLRDLDDGLLDGELPGGQVEVAVLEGDELAPAQAGVDGGFHHQAMLRGQRGEDRGVLVGVRVRAFFLTFFGSSCKRGR